MNAQIKDNSKELKAEYINEVMTKIYNNSNSMRKYFENGVSQVIKTSEGFLIEFSKPSIETRFCFSYDEHVSGSHENACKQCDIKADYFIKHNLRDLTKGLKELENEEIFLIKNYDKSDLIMQFVSKQYIETYTNTPCKKISDADKQMLIDAQKQEIEKFTKRLNTYLKKYGTEKLHTWTYSCWD